MAKTKTAPQTKPSTSDRAKTLAPKDRVTSKAAEKRAEEEKAARQAANKEKWRLYYAQKRAEKRAQKEAEKAAAAKAATKPARTPEQRAHLAELKAHTKSLAEPSAPATDAMTLSRAELLAALKAHRIAAIKSGDQARVDALTIALGLAEQLA